MCYFRIFHRISWYNLKKIECYVKLAIGSQLSYKNDFLIKFKNDFISKFDLLDKFHNFASLFSTFRRFGVCYCIINNNKHTQLLNLNLNLNF